MKNSLTEPTCYPSLLDVQKGIEMIKNESWDKYDSRSDLNQHLEKVKEKISKHLYNIPLLRYIIPEEANHKLNLFRVRPLDEFKNLNLSCEYSYPPIKCCTKIERINFPGHPVFYASAHPIIALTEVIKDNLKENACREYCISRWEIRYYKGLKVTPYLFAESDNTYNDFAKNILEKIPEIYKDRTKDQSEAVKALLKFYCEKFLEEEDYSISSYLGHNHLYAPSNDRTDIMMYPSVQLKRLRYEALNYAIHPNVVDERIYITRTYIIKVNITNLEKKEFLLTVSKYAEVIDGFFYWKQITPDNERYKELVAIDFGENFNWI
jgi:hypothetical protein